MIYFISSACPGLCDSIPMAIHDEEGNIEDILKTEKVEDDILDAWRYGLKSMLAGGSKPREVEIEERLAALPSPHAKSMMHRFLQRRFGRSQTFALRGHRR